MSEDKAKYVALTANGAMPGYMRDAQGRLVPVENVKEIDLMQNALVKDLLSKVRDQSRRLAALKAEILSEIEAFVELCSEQYGVKRGGGKGNVSLVSYDGTQKITRAMDELISFGPQLQAARALIEECLEDWTSDARNEVKVIVQDAFRVDSQGRLSTSRILGLRRLNIQDERWQSAMQAIADSVQVIGRTTYVRAYQRTDTNGTWSIVPLN